MLSFLFQVASVKVQMKTSDESHTLLFKNVPVYVRTSIPDQNCIPYC